MKWRNQGTKIERANGDWVGGKPVCATFSSYFQLNQGGPGLLDWFSILEGNLCYIVDG